MHSWKMLGKILCTTYCFPYDKQGSDMLDNYACLSNAGGRSFVCSAISEMCLKEKWMCQIIVFFNFIFSEERVK